MAFATKYRLEFSDIHVSTKADWKIDFLFKDYAGSIITLTGSDDPLVITKGKDTDDRFETILGSSAQINIVVEKETFKVDDFFRLEEFDVRCDSYKDGSLFWRGFVTPDYCEYPYTPLPFKMTIQATDGISGLKSKFPELTLIQDSNGLIKILSF